MCTPPRQRRQHYNISVNEAQPRSEHNAQLYLRMSRRNWRQFVALHVRKLASGSGVSGISHNVTLLSPQHRLNFALLQLLLE